MPRSGRETTTCHCHCRRVADGGLARTRPPSPRASLPTWANRASGTGDARTFLRQPGLHRQAWRHSTPTGEDGRPRRSTSCLLAHLPIAISVVSPGILQGQPPPGRWARPPLSRHLACWHQGGPRCTGALEGSEPTRSNPGSQRGHLWFAGERRLNFEKWWHKGMGTCQASHLGVVLSLFLKPLKCKTSFCTFLHFFFFFFSSWVFVSFYKHTFWVF